MEQNYSTEFIQEDPNVSDLRKAMTIRAAILAGFHMEKRRDGTLAFGSFDKKQNKWVYLDIPGSSRMPVSVYALNMQKIGEVYNSRAQDLENRYPDVKLPRMQTEFEIIKGNPAAKGKNFKTIASDMGDDIDYYEAIYNAATNHREHFALGVQDTIADTLLTVKQGADRHNGYTKNLYEELHAFFTDPEISRRLNFSKQRYDEMYQEIFGDKNLQQNEQDASFGA